MYTLAVTLKAGRKRGDSRMGSCPIPPSSRPTWRSETRRRSHTPLGLPWPWGVQRGRLPRTSADGWWVGGFSAYPALTACFIKGVGGGGGNRTRVREHSTLGSTCLAASLSLTVRCPTGRACERRARLGFSRATPGESHDELVWVDPRDWAHKHTQAEAGYLRLSSQSVVVVVGNYLCLQLDLRGLLRLGMHLRLCYPRRTQSPPSDGLCPPLYSRRAQLSRRRHVPQPALSSRSFWRCHSRSFSAARLSNLRLPLAMATSSFATAFFQ